MREEKEIKSEILKTTLKRLPLYYNMLKNMEKSDMDYISSSLIAENLNLNPILVRKDLAYVSHIPGKPRIGFEISALIEDIEAFLGYKNITDAVLIGVGRLGRALLSYEFFKEYGLNIVSGFDVDEDLVGLKINGKPVFPMDKVEHIIKRLNVNLGIVTVPQEKAQDVCNILIDAGIKAIWNFAPTHIILKNNVIIKNENLAASLAYLSHKLDLALNN